MHVVGHLPDAGPDTAAAAIDLSSLMAEVGKPIASLPYMLCGHAPVLNSLHAFLLTLLRDLILFTLLFDDLNLCAIMQPNSR